jgi:hypothetical protein
MNDKTWSSPEDACEQLFVNPIAISRIPKNGELVGWLKRLDFCDVLTDLLDRSGIRRKGIKKEKEEKNQACLKPDPVTYIPLIFKTFFLQFFPGIVYVLTYLPYIISTKKAMEYEISE